MLIIIVKLATMVLYEFIDGGKGWGRKSVLLVAYKNIKIIIISTFMELSGTFPGTSSSVSHPF